MAKIAILGCLLFGGFAWPVAEQTKSEEEQVTIRLDVNLILLHVAVQNGSGQFVPGLEKRDFQLLVDRSPRPITVFERDDAPVAAGIVVDNSVSMNGKGPEVIGASVAFARASNPQDEMFVVHFSDQVRLGLPPGKLFTGSITDLEIALSRFTPEGTTALYDAMSLAIAHLHQTKLERKVLLIISDGGDNSSRRHFADIVKLAQEAGVIVYCVGIYDDTDRDRNPRVLTQFAELTGGKAFFPSELKDVTDTCIKIAGDIRQQYTLGFEGKEDGEYHSIQVILQNQKHGDARVRTRTGYFAARP